MMFRKRVTIVGGGMGCVAVLRSLVRNAYLTGRTDMDITIFERSDTIGPGVAYRLNLPDSFLLNHELDHMGNVNIKSDDIKDETDFYNWVQETKAYLVDRYPDFDLERRNEYVPRSLYGRYLKAKYQEIKQQAENLDIKINEHTSTEVENVVRQNGEFVVKTAHGEYRSDVNVLATGNWFNSPKDEFPKATKVFVPYADDLSYLDSNVIPNNSTLIIRGTGLTAYDIAIAALESGLYEKVLMASRNGRLRAVRGRIEPYQRKFLTIPKLEHLAGGVDHPFKLADVIDLIQKELNFIYGGKVDLNEKHSVDEIVEKLRFDIEQAEADTILKWRSFVLSIGYDERNEIYRRLQDKDKPEFLKNYSAILNFFAPMPSTNARKLLGFIEDGRLEIHNGVQSFEYVEASDVFVMTCQHNAQGKPIIGATVEGAVVTKHQGNVFADSSGISRDISLQPLFFNMAAGQTVEANPFGGLRFDEDSFQVVVDGENVNNLYCIGQMQIGTTIQPVNSILIARHGEKVGADIILNDPNYFSLRATSGFDTDYPKVREGLLSLRI